MALRKEFFEKIYINRQVVQEANMINFGFDYLGKIRTVNLLIRLTLIKMEARSETDTNKCYSATA